MLKLYNSLTRRVEEFQPLNPPKVGMYTCGPTVYDFDHIGHARKYVNDDILRRALQEEGYEVKHVQNITDVGHLVSDADEGEDKLEKGAKRSGKTVWEVAEFYTKHFYDSMDKLNILRPTIVCKATDHIQEQIDLIEKLIKGGFAYETEEAVYYDVSKFENYHQLFGQKIKDKIEAAREEVQKGKQKKHPADFVLWFKRVGRFENHTMHWDSPWGNGFPGWHIECSAMSMKYLGSPIDIHTGGVDHLSLHHPNEIAQSEGAVKTPFVHFWVHHEFLMVDSQKMSKSLGNIYRVEDIEKKGYSALDLRYFYLTAHYRKQLNFTFEALTACQNARKTLTDILAKLKTNKEEKEKRTILSEDKLEKINNYRQEFFAAVSDDLNLPKALSILWALVKSNIPSIDKYELLLEFDHILGLDLAHVGLSQKEIKIPEKVFSLVKQRNLLRSQEKWEEADAVRKKIEEEGFFLEDSIEGTKVTAKD